VAYDFDLIVIGGGAAGLVASKFAAGLSKKVLLIERSRLGGECTLYGCVPSKTLIRTARVFHEMRHAGDVGLDAGPPPVAGESVLARVRRVVERVYEGHRPEVLESLGIRVLIGRPRFRDNHSVEVEGRLASAASFIICTGSSPLVPPIDGIETVPYLTNETIFDMEQLPRSLVVLGGGPIGVEMAQAFNYLGVSVTLLEAADRILIREDKELCDLLAGRLVGQGLALRTGTMVKGVGSGRGAILVNVENTAGRQYSVTADALLVAAGRKANVDSLDLEAAGVEYSPKGVKTDGKLRTTAGNIYACGDAAGPYPFSHMAEHQARIAAQNALFPLKRRADLRHYIWCTFADPEFAHAGLTESEARERYGDGLRIYRWKFGDIDRAKTEAEEFGLAKFICDRSYRLIGAHILGARAGELIHEAQILKTLGIPFYKLDSVIHVYPTFSDAIKQPAKIAHIEKVRNSFLVKVAEKLFLRRPRPISRPPGPQ
jgi:pyruvate/2-oxoglutarate dehydrogenase complex dihydrolipoamide dehydrogenase (E3) component